MRGARKEFMVTAIVLINVEHGRVNDVAAQLLTLPGVTEVYSVGGRFDLVAVARVKDNDAIVNERARTAANPRLNRPGVPGLLDAIQASQTTSRSVNAVLVRVREGFGADAVAQDIRRWKHLEAFTRAQMEEILVAKLIATSARQIGMFLVILAVVSAAIVSFIIYTMTLGKIRELAVLKLIGTRNRTIAGMILQESLGLCLLYTSPSPRDPTRSRMPSSA